MYYRRKVLLALLEKFDRKLGKIDLQKLLMLFSKQSNSKTFDFLPYQFGCYSYQANWDLGALRLKNIIIETEKQWTLNTDENYFEKIKLEDQEILEDLYEKFRGSSTNQLLHYTYINYPYYSTKSKVLKKVLSKEELGKLATNKIYSDDKTTLFTIGYEGVSLEAYFNKLIQNDVKVLCDVRKNPLSQKFGFSKKMLQEVCNGMSIKYIHIGELGINSEKRKSLHTSSDYQQLFENYKKELPSLEKDYEVILQLLEKYKRVALTCFEAEACCCHRGTLADYLTTTPTWSYQLKHL